MNSNKLNRWLTLLANVGVLVGIAILVVEIQQSQNIALASRTNELTQREFAVNELIIENVQLVNRMNAEEQLTDIDLMIADRVLRSLHMAHFMSYQEAVLLDASGQQAPIRTLAVILHENSGLKSHWRLRQQVLADQLNSMSANSEVFQSFHAMVEGYLSKLENAEMKSNHL